ncbi:type II toxin-antitoxin system VapC family toxin [Pleomorphomonas sp. NRK KF1]|uniref:type II toxin-antitoxin system VapC family toxin n=1 Tax=Pleomorphomonas sp. NRK KF1 TaxID=2943000 RepID=UPI002044BB78|nr:type II toxin-antitoxin system VapC family toxin [Pleomorphomonas sp. NRK KF1]MCM5555056.1 type II toxin-antitoxin system VapC family toxin [Pleomorphomonas sp. NRK KF1]
MRVVDTSAWLEYMSGSTTGQLIAAELPGRHEWLVPTIVQLEMAKFLLRTAGESLAEDVAAFSQKCIVVPLDTDMALTAAEIGLRHKLAMADAIVYATAQLFEADLLTCDAHFKDLDGVRYVPKTAAAAKTDEARS